MNYTKEDVEKLAVATFQDAAKAEKWLHTPINALNGCTPYSILRDEEGMDEVISILDRIASGEFT
ncbi:MbcA/ParS/Xre antitoxin family protein [Sedimenticola selenatireducens]|uniref:MbcA/ParS/Xre antitoxin family protein n=1 Tax=Sedimenticola selenatireducens TaxID=191960 RepID=UPI002AAA632E|nr:MbcA/ParS/Xre antitoxin family protein [Sedimenticola selenatireducens]